MLRAFLAITKSRFWVLMSEFSARSLRSRNFVLKPNNFKFYIDFLIDCMFAGHDSFRGQSYVGYKSEMPNLSIGVRIVIFRPNSSLSCSILKRNCRVETVEKSATSSLITSSLYQSTDEWRGFNRWHFQTQKHDFQILPLEAGVHEVRPRSEDFLQVTKRREKEACR